MIHFEELDCENVVLIHWSDENYSRAWIIVLV